MSGIWNNVFLIAPNAKCRCARIFIGIIGRDSNNYNLRNKITQEGHETCIWITLVGKHNERSVMYAMMSRLCKLCRPKLRDKYLKFLPLDFAPGNVWSLFIQIYQELHCKVEDKPNQKRNWDNNSRWFSFFISSFSFLSFCLFVFLVIFRIWSTVSSSISNSSTIKLVFLKF